jgi:hypothetical protein
VNVDRDLLIGFAAIQASVLDPNDLPLGSGDEMAALLAVSAAKYISRHCEIESTPLRTQKTGALRR